MKGEVTTIGSEKEILRLEGVTKSFAGVMAVHQVDIRLMPQEIRALIGPNGAGKTTLFNLITGHLPLDAGRIFFEGVEITGFPPYSICQRRLSRTFQITSIFPRMTVLENVQAAIFSRQGRIFDPLSRAKGIALDMTMEHLKTVGLLDEANKISGSLSLGDQKLLELGIALATEPKLLLLDEPTAGMALHERLELMALITRIVNDKQLTVLFIEHDMDVVFSIAQRISVLHQGKIIAEDDPLSIRANEEVQGVYLGWQKLS